MLSMSTILNISFSMPFHTKISRLHHHISTLGCTLLVDILDVSHTFLAKFYVYIFLNNVPESTSAYKLGRCARSDSKTTAYYKKTRRAYFLNDLLGTLFAEVSGKTNARYYAMCGICKIKGMMVHRLFLHRSSIQCGQTRN
jgi:hypothetical protein